MLSEFGVTHRDRPREELREFKASRLIESHDQRTDLMVLKVAPPLTINQEQLQAFVDALADVVELMHRGGSFWSEPLGMARRILGSIIGDLRQWVGRSERYRRIRNLFRRAF